MTSWGIGLFVLFFAVGIRARPMKHLNVIVVAVITVVIVAVGVHQHAL